jgi:hypothetical protein
METNGVEMALFVYDSPAFENFLKNNPHERGEVSSIPLSQSLSIPTP